jgi:hypothetical protein
MKSLEEGLCPFTASDESVEQKETVEELREQLQELRLRMDRFDVLYGVYCVSHRFDPLCA